MVIHPFTCRKSFEWQTKTRTHICKHTHIHTYSAVMWVVVMSLAIFTALVAPHEMDNR